MRPMNEVSIRENEIVVIRPFSLTHALAYTFLFVFVNSSLGVENLLAGNFADISPWAGISQIVATILWLWILSGVRTRTVFDATQREVRRRNLFGYTRCYSFDHIAAIVTIISNNGCYFQLILRHDLYGKGMRFTKTYVNPIELEYMTSAVVPAINHLVFGMAQGAPLTDEEEAALVGKPLDEPRAFKKINDEVYEYSRISSAFGIMSGGGALVWCGFHYMQGLASIILVLLGILSVFYCFTFNWRVAFYLDKGQCVVTWPFFLWRSRLRLNLFLHFEPIRTLFTATYLGTWLYLEGDTLKGKNARFLIMWTRFFPNRLSAVANEGQQIIDAHNNRKLIEQNETHGKEYITRIKRPYLEIVHHDHFA